MYNCCLWEYMRSNVLLCTKMWDFIQICPTLYPQSHQKKLSPKNVPLSTYVGSGTKQEVTYYSEIPAVVKLGDVKWIQQLWDSRLIRPSVCLSVCLSVHLSVQACRLGIQRKMAQAQQIWSIIF